MEEDKKREEEGKEEKKEGALTGVYWFWTNRSLRAQPVLPSGSEI